MQQKLSVSPLANIRSRCNDVKRKVTQVVNNLVQYSYTNSTVTLSLGMEEQPCLEVLDIHSPIFW